MIKNLENLDETLNQTVLKNIKFNQKNKNMVFRMIDSNKKRKDNLFKRVITPVLSIAVPVCFLIVLLNFFVTDLDSSKSKHGYKNPIATNDKEIDYPSTLYKPEPNEEIYADMTKEEVLEKLLNTEKYFKTAKGRFIEYNSSIGQWEVEYQIINNGNNSTGYSRVYKPIDAPFESTYFNKKSLWKIDEKKRIYSKLSSTDPTPKVLVGLAKDSLFPSEFVNNFMGDLANWNIEEQNVQLNEHNTLVIKGTFDETAKEKQGTSSYRIWVDKDTGILIQYETYRDDNATINSIYTSELRINDPIRIASLKPMLKGFTRKNP